MTEQVEPRICVRFCIKLEHPPWKLFQWFRRPQLWASGDWQLHCNNAPAHVSQPVQLFCETSHHPGVAAPYNPDLVPCDFCFFPKLKSPLKGRRFQTIIELQENTMGQLMVIRRTVWGPKVPTLKGTEAPLSYVQYFLYLVSSSVNVSIFHITWLNTFWTDLVNSQVTMSTELCLWILFLCPCFAILSRYWWGCKSPWTSQKSHRGQRWDSKRMKLEQLRECISIREFR